MRKPIIAITADSFIEPTPIINQQFANFVPRDLKEVILKEGGIPIVLPFPDDITLADEISKSVIELVDGVIIPGGADVDPIHYHEEPINELGRTLYQRDAYELSIIKAAKDLKKPVFGICRGLQLMNVAFGGTLYQDLIKQNPDSYMKHAQDAPGNFPTHYIDIEEDSIFFNIFGPKAYVNSRHHQGVKDVGTGFRVTARAADGVVEAIESSQNSLFAVQWHPENMWRDDDKQLQIFRDFIKRCQS